MKIKPIICLTVLSVLVMGSCSKQEVISGTDQNGNLMEVSAYMSRDITTKSTTANTTVPFNLYVTYNDAQYVPVSTMTYDGSKWIYGDGSKKYYWPADATKLKFYGVMDYEGGSTVTTRTISTAAPSTISVASVSGSEDLCVTYANPTSSSMSGAMGLTFNHAYTKFNFKLKAASSAAAAFAYEITAMTISAKQAGTLTVAATPSWASGDPTGDANSYTLSYTAGKQTLTTTAGDAFGDLMIIPQAGVELSITYNVYASAGSTTILSSPTKNATIDMSDKIGKSSTYILSLDGATDTKAITFTTVEGNWTDNADETINM